ncbi:MAG: hypothetical protein AAB365_00120 [Patescibacteria group bacterium]
MTIILFILGVFLLWQGQMQFTKKNAHWPKEKKNGRIIGAILLLPLIIEYAVILVQ